MFTKRIRPFFQGAIINILMILGVIGIAAIMYGFKYDLHILILGMAILLITGISLSGYYGIQIDYSQKKYKHFLSLLGIKIGSWKPLPVIEKIVLAPQKHYMRRSFERIDLAHEIFLIKLIPSGFDHAIIASMGRYGDLMLEADTLSKNLGIPVVEDTK
jgi:hypothetical protein